MLNEQILYEDKYVRISDEDMTLFCYYIPFGQNKIIKFSEIKEIKMEELTFMSGKYRLWGMNLNFCFFPLDVKRCKKSHFISLNVGGRIKPSFTSDNLETIYKILVEKI